MQSRSEVGQARSHLSQVQSFLAATRVACARRRTKHPLLRTAEANVLAALSWLWDAQQREIMQEGFDMMDALRRGVLTPGDVRAQLGLPLIVSKPIDPATLAVLQDHRGVLVAGE